MNPDHKIVLALPNEYLQARMKEDYDEKKKERASQLEQERKIAQEKGTLFNVVEQQKIKIINVVDIRGAFQFKSGINLITQEDMSYMCEPKYKNKKVFEGVYLFLDEVDMPVEEENGWHNVDNIARASYIYGSSAIGLGEYEKGRYKFPANKVKYAS